MELAEHLSITGNGASKSLKKLLEKSLTTKSKLKGNNKIFIINISVGKILFKHIKKRRNHLQ